MGGWRSGQKENISGNYLVMPRDSVGTDVLSKPQKQFWFLWAHEQCDSAESLKNSEIPGWLHFSDFYQPGIQPSKPKAKL